MSMRYRKLNIYKPYKLLMLIHLDQCDYIVYQRHKKGELACLLGTGLRSFTFNQYLQTTLILCIFLTRMCWNKCTLLRTDTFIHMKVQIAWMNDTFIPFTVTMNHWGHPSPIRYQNGQSLMWDSPTHKRLDRWLTDLEMAWGIWKDNYMSRCMIRFYHTRPIVSRGCGSCLVMNIHNPFMHCVTSQCVFKPCDVIMLTRAVTIIAA